MITALIVCLLSALEATWFYGFIKQDFLTEETPIEEKMLCWSFVFGLTTIATSFIFFLTYFISKIIGVY